MGHNNNNNKKDFYGRHEGPNPTVYTIAHFGVDLVARYFWRNYVVNGKNNLSKIPKNATLLVAPSHESHPDPFLIGHKFDKWPLSFFSKKENFEEIPPIAKLLEDLGTFSYDRDNLVDGRDVANEAHVKNLLQGVKGNLMMFPEGGRSKDGNFSRPQPGLAIFGLQAQLANPDHPYVIVPVSITHTETIEDFVKRYAQRAFKDKVEFKKFPTWEKLQWLERISRAFHNNSSVYINIHLPISLQQVAKETDHGKILRPAMKISGQVMDQIKSGFPLLNQRIAAYAFYSMSDQGRKSVGPEELTPYVHELAQQAQEAGAWMPEPRQEGWVPHALKYLKRIGAIRDGSPEWRMNSTPRLEKEVNRTKHFFQD